MPDSRTARPLRVLPQPGDPLRLLTPREREVLGLVAQGRSNAAICGALCVAPKTLERHMQHIYAKLGLEPSDHSHRRVLATLAWERSRLAAPDRVAAAG